jgi:Cof subfamily protein (haloacid dehalogenase superfamily)
MSTVYISDLDGTLLNSQGALSQFTVSSLQQLLDEGVDFSVASARSVITIQHVLPGIKLDLPVVEFNGAFVSDLATGHHHIINDLDQGIVSDLYRLLESTGCQPFISSFDGNNDRLYCPEATNFGMQWYIDERVVSRDSRLSETPDFRAVLNQQIICLTSIGSHDDLAEIERQIIEDYGSLVETHLFENHYSPPWHWLTVHDRRATKDQGIRSMLEMTGLNARQLMVFGDHINDLKMFELANHAVAVANAIDAVKESAHQVIGSNDEDSVVKHIRSHRAG